MTAVVLPDIFLPESRALRFGLPFGAPEVLVVAALPPDPGFTALIDRGLVRPRPAAGTNVPDPALDARVRRLRAWVADLMDRGWLESVKHPMPPAPEPESTSDIIAALKGRPPKQAPGPAAPEPELVLYLAAELEREVAEAEAGLAVLAEVAPTAYYLPFFQALVALRQGDLSLAAERFAQAEPLQPGQAERALCAFYQAYALSQDSRWEDCVEHLDRAIALDEEVKEYFNLRGVSRFKAGLYELAKDDFHAVLALDSGSAPDLANLGLCHKFLGQSQDAQECLQAALQLDSSLDYARKHLDELLNAPRA